MNLVSVVNSLFGTAYFHNTAAMASTSDAVEVSSVTGELEGTTTTDMIPSPSVPMLKPLQQLGVPSHIVDALNSRLKPIVDAGYSRLTPDAGPHFSHGQLVGLPAPLASPKDVPTSARVSNGVRSAVDSIRNSDSRRATESTTRVAGTPTGSIVDRRTGNGGRAALRHVVDEVTKRLTRLTDFGSNDHGSRRFTEPGAKADSHSANSFQRSVVPAGASGAA